MEDASRIEAQPLSGREFSFVQHSRFDMRPIVPGLLYLAVYALLVLGVKAAGLSFAVNDYGLTAGLNIGFLAAYGIWYAPWAFVATVGGGLYLNPLPFSVQVSILYCLTISLAQIATAICLRHWTSGHRASLKCGRDLAKFVFIGTAASLAMAAATTTCFMFGRTIQRDWFLSQLQIHFIGFATGLLCITPILLIHFGPWLETILFGIKAEKSVQTSRLHSFQMDRPGTLFALSFVSLAVLSIWLIFGMGISDTFFMFLLLSVPMIWVAINRGIEGVSVATPILFAIAIAAFWESESSIDSIENLLAILATVSLNASMIAIGLTQTRVTDWQVERRNAILDAVDYAARKFLGNTGWEAGVQEVMKRLGEATDVTRVFITDNRTPNLGGQIGDTSLYEWTNSSLSVDEKDKQLLDLLRSQIIEELADKFSQGQPFLFRTKDVFRKRREMLETFGIRSGVIIPMFVEQQWWGCLGLEQCVVDRDWPDSEIEGLKMAGQILGTLIASVRVEQQFRQLTGNIQAVFWISSPDSHSKQYVSPGYDEIWGQTRVSLQKNPMSWLQAIHAEDQTRVYDALEKQAWGEYDEVYRVIRPDRSICWVHDRAFPVRDQTGTVYRVVGIAEDITGQKKVEEQLRAATVLLSSLIDHLQSGILVEDEERRITHVNQAFNGLFNIPVSEESLFGVDSRLLFSQTADFAERIEQIIGNRIPVLGEELEWQDKILRRNYVPLSIDENNRYHLWQYQDITNSKKAEEQIKSSLKEKEVLLKEIHHRVKNNLQIISSLLNLQSTEIEDPGAGQKFRESQDRVKAMALIHERLYQSNDLAKIDFSGYVRNLTGHLLRSYKVNASAIRLDLEIDAAPTDLDVAIPCGLIINELVSNALKYAFPEDENGRIQVRFSEENSHGLKLVVRDSGVGFPEDQNPENSDSLGLKLVRSLTDQLSGTINYCNQNGCICEISFPYNRP